jgi:hypothetical protein
LNRELILLDILVVYGTLEILLSQPLLPSLRLLLEHAKETSIEETPVEVTRGVLAHFHGSCEDFKFLQQNCCPSYYELSQWTRNAVACIAVYDSWDITHMPELMQTMLGPHPLTAEDLEIDGPWGFSRHITTFVHCVVSKIGQHQAALQEYHPSRFRVLHPSRESK